MTCNANGNGRVPDTHHSSQQGNEAELVEAGKLHRENAVGLERLMHSLLLLMVLSLLQGSRDSIDEDAYLTEQH